MTVPPVEINLRYILVRGWYKQVDGVTPETGYLEFTPSTPLSHPYTGIIRMDTARVDLDENGKFEISLLCTDIGGMIPTGWMWFFEEKIKNGNSGYFELLSTMPNPVDFATMVVIPPTEPPSHGVPGTVGIGPNMITGQTTTVPAGTPAALTIENVGPNTFEVDAELPEGIQGVPGSGALYVQTEPPDSDDPYVDGVFWVDTDETAEEVLKGEPGPASYVVQPSAPTYTHDLLWMDSDEAWVDTGSSTATVEGSVKGDAVQRIAVPSYFYPTWYNAVGGVHHWERMQDDAPYAELCVINPSNGPGTSVNADYATQVTRARAAGLKVYGYVSTSYTTVDPAVVKANVDKHIAWYNVDGIFLDEGSWEAGKVAHYVDLYTYIKAKGLSVILNPGVAGIDEGYMNASDIILNFENTPAVYTSTTFPSWTINYKNNRFWHVVHTVASEAERNTVLSKMATNRAGYVYLTTDVMPNPYDTLPVDPFWSGLVSAVSGSGGAAAPTRTTVSKTTTSLAAGASESGTIALAPGYRLYSISTTVPCRVRLYTTIAAQTADLSRPIGTDVADGAGVMLEYVTTSGLLSAALSPVVDGFDGKTTPDGVIPIVVTNTGVGSTTVGVTFLWIRSE